MSDEKLRELERDWRETGSLEGEVTLLRERLRVGDLETTQLERAAILNHYAALRLQQRAEDWPGSQAASLERFNEVLSWGAEAMGRAVVAVAHKVAPYIRQLDGSLPEEAARLLSLADIYLSAESERGNAARSALALESDRFAPSIYSLHASAKVASAARLYACAARACFDWQIDSRAEAGRGVFRWASRVGTQIAWRAVRADLVPWLLGTADPLRARVQAVRARRSERSTRTSPAE
ncbi:MAG: hypothetical protein JKY65_15495 [Planctomycetes bacterium]|nr:hypothetical protein [Planctomycetota bacterium]